MDKNELACIWASMVEISDRSKEILFSIAEPEFLMKNLSVYEEEIKCELSDSDFFNLSKIGEVDVLNFINKMEKQKIKIITRFSKEYPKSLFDLSNPPFVLYCVGNVSLLSSKCLTVVGTRKCSESGYKICESITSEIASKGVTIVSGLADGIDSAAHIGALSSGGKTIAVLGFGITELSTSANRNIAVDIVKKGGLIISEYPPHFPGSKFTFPVRNRIMAALSLVTLLVEAPTKSGSRYTVENAIRMKRIVFAIPGKIGSENSELPHELIKNNLAFCLTSCSDILEKYGINKEDESEEYESDDLGLDEEESVIFNLLKVEDLHITQLADKTNYEIKKLNNLLTNMEISGIISKLAGGYFTMNK